MKKIFFVLITLTIFSFQCKRKNCHYSIKIINDTDSEVVFASLIPGFDSNKNLHCRLDGQLIAAHSVKDYSVWRGCYENSIANEVFDVYFVNPKKFNAPSFYFNCDSASYYNDIIKVIPVSHDYLKANDYSVIFN